MPMFDFRCDDCNKSFEELVRRDYKEVPCPRCGSTKTQRLLSTFSSRTGGARSVSSIPSGGGCAPSG
jgi:putative FmdB family regulatory protein